MSGPDGIDRQAKWRQQEFTGAILWGIQ